MYVYIQQKSSAYTSPHLTDTYYMVRPNPLIESEMNKPKKDPKNYKKEKNDSVQTMVCLL